MVAQLDAELVADPVRGRALVIEMGRALRGLGLAQDTTYLAFREPRSVGLIAKAANQEWRKAA